MRPSTSIQKGFLTSPSKGVPARVAATDPPLDYAMFILILEDSRRLYEYDTAQFRDGAEVKHEGYDRQLVLPVEQAKRIWVVA